MADFSQEDGNEISHLGLYESGIHGSAEMELELAACARYAGQSGNSRKLATLVIEHIASEDVRALITSDSA